MSGLTYRERMALRSPDWLDQATLDLARHQVESTPASIASWLDDECMADREPLDVDRLMERDIGRMCVPELLLVAMHDYRTHRRCIALDALLRKFRESSIDDVEMRAIELACEADRENEANADAAAADRLDAAAPEVDQP